MTDKETKEKNIDEYWDMSFGSDAIEASRNSNPLNLDQKEETEPNEVLKGFNKFMKLPEVAEISTLIFI